MTRARALLVAVLAAVVGLLALAGPASAHVTVAATGATQGGYAVLTFRVPTEKDDANTTKLQVSFPTQTPISSVRVQEVPGWKAAITKSKLATPIQSEDGEISEAVSMITWTATGDGIKPDEFGQFPVSVGPLPKTDSVSFPAIQTYSDGSTVAWNETPAPGSTTEPEHPAPSLTLAAPGDDAPAGSSSSSSSDAPTVSASGSSSSSNTGPYVLAVIALVVAAGAAGLSVVGRAKARKDG